MSGRARWVATLAFTALAVGGVSLYAYAMQSEAPTSFERSLLLLAAGGVLTGIVGDVLTLLAYRLELGRVPRPDLWILAEGTPLHHVRLPIRLLSPKDSFEKEVQGERERLEAQIEESQRPSVAEQPGRGVSLSSVITAFSNVGMNQRVPPSSGEIQEFREAIERYLGEFEEFLKYKSLHDAFWARSHKLPLKVTNDRAGVPAQGVKVILRIETDEIRAFDLEDCPEEPQSPRPPKPPKPRTLMESLNVGIPDLASLMSSMAVAPEIPLVGRSNVSGPTIRKGSVVIEYEIDEVLHNIGEDTAESPVVTMFNAPGSWKIDYEIHARNLPRPKRGSRLVEAVDEDVEPTQGGSRLKPLTNLGRRLIKRWRLQNSRTGPSKG